MRNLSTTRASVPTNALQLDIEDEKYTRPSPATIRRGDPAISSGAAGGRVPVAVQRAILAQVAELTAFAGYKTRRYQPGQLVQLRCYEARIYLSEAPSLSIFSERMA